MPVRKFGDIAEMGDNTWRQSGHPDLFRAIRACWSFASRQLRAEFPPGVYKHRSIEEADRLCEEWAQANFDRYRARQR